jgi:glutamate racemase
MIGIFDSGLGGLSVASAIRREFPSADLLYFGDTKHAPYGEKSPAEIAMLTVRGLEALRSRGATSIVSACNSVSTALAVSLVDTFDLPADSVIEMVGPTVASLRGMSGNILLVATTATVRSGIYQNAFRMIGMEIDAIAIPHLAGAIERGASEDERDGIVRSALGGMPGGAYSALILGCTHYPFAMSSFKKVVGEEVVIVDPADAVASRVVKRLWPREVGESSVRILASMDTPALNDKVREIFPGYTGQIEVIE